MSGVPVLDRFKHALGERYRIERLIGSGGMADVYLAEDRKHHRKVAIKLFKPDLSTRLGPDRFLREIDIAAKLTHPNILPLHDSGSADGLLFFVMPYIEGESLRRRLSRDGPMAVSDVIRIVKEIVDGLTYAHSQGVVHRDIKPDNVLMAGRHALVADFGVAKAVSDVTIDQEVTSFGAVIGTPSYMAPEQAAASAIDHRADIYAVGAVAYELLTGRSPFQWKVSRETTVEGAVEPLGVHRPDVPAALDALVMRCLAKSRDERWQTGAELLAALEAMSDTATPTPLPEHAIANPKRRRAYVLAGVSATVVIVAAAWMSGVFAPRRGEAWLRGSAIPAIRQLADDGNYIAAHVLAMEADTVHPDDAALAAEWDRFTGRVGIASDPPGAQVYVRQDGATQEWYPLGETPLENIRFPRGGAYRVRFQKAGYRTYEGMVTAGWLSPGFTFPLSATGSITDDLIAVRGGTISVESPGGERLPALQLNDFLIDRYEVTNRRFKAFVDAGGYTRREFWREPFVKQGRVQSWEDAMRAFVDQTGRPGPAQWELSAYPKGQDDEPVRGVSWYEAAAYAAFEGRDLPTIYHWNRAAGIAAASSIVAASNFSETGPKRVGTAAGISRFGVADMAGNVREWCFNQSLQQGAEGRFILGGGWNDAAYMFTDLYAQSPWDRSPSNGLRLVTYRDTGDALERSKSPVTTDVRDFKKEKPVDDREYDVYRRMYAYDRTPLNAMVERTDTADDWIRHRVSFDAAYGGERMLAYLYLPKKARPPYQTVVYFPGSFAIFQRSIDADFSVAWDFLVKGGRAVLFPIYRGTFDRQTELNSDLPNETVAYRDYVVQWAKDLGRSLDYLETRTDIDARKTAYFGFSWGGRLGGLLLAVEPRLKAGVLHVAGLKFQRALPEADPVNFVRRITVPVLMLNGKYDQFFPLETSQVPMFQMLGTPLEHKRHVVYEAGHFVPRPQLAKETLDWLDRYLGPISVASGDDASR